MLLNIKQRLLVLVLCIAGVTAQAGTHEDLYYRAFWNPVVHGTRLDYCNSSARVCGLPLARDFCKIMGYETVSQASIDYNVGITRYLDNAKICKGWRCHGWNVIRCKSHIKKKLMDEIQSRIFYFPRMHWARVDYCYMKDHGCGKRAAYAFCRSMSFEHVGSFKKEHNVLSTCTLGEQRRCFGYGCDGFAQITCTR